MKTPKRICFRLLIMLTIGFLSFVVLFGCSDDSGNKPKPTSSPEPKIEPVDQYKKASANFDEYDFVDYSLIYDVTLSNETESTDALLNTRVKENNRGKDSYQLESNASLSVGSLNSNILLIYKDGVYYQEMDNLKNKSMLTYEEYCAYIDESNDSVHGDDSFIQSYKEFTREESAHGNKIIFSQCDKESAYIKGEVITAMSLCGLEITPESITIVSSDGYAHITDENISNEVKEITAIVDYLGEKINLSITITLNVNSINVENNITTPDESQYQTIPYPTFPNDLYNIYCDLVKMQGFNLSTKNSVSFVINNTSATYTDSNSIIYIKTNDITKFDIDFTQTIKCSKLSPKTTTNNVTEDYNSEDGTYIAYENKTKVAEEEMSADQASRYVELILADLVPDYSLVETIDIAVSEDDSSITTYTFVLKNDYIHAYCAYYMTYFDSSLSYYPYDSAAIEAPEGKIVITVDSVNNVITDVETTMSCKYNYQSKYTISFDFSSETKVLLPTGQE